jgi:hypothetical protein
MACGGLPPLSGWKRPDDRRMPGAREFHPFGPPRADPIAEAIGPHSDLVARLRRQVGCPAPRVPFHLVLCAWCFLSTWCA